MTQQTQQPVPSPEERLAAAKLARQQRAAAVRRRHDRSGTSTPIRPSANDIAWDRYFRWSEIPAAGFGAASNHRCA